MAICPHGTNENKCIHCGNVVERLERLEKMMEGRAEPAAKEGKTAPKPEKTTCPRCGKEGSIEKAVNGMLRNVIAGMSNHTTIHEWDVTRCGCPIRVFSDTDGEKDAERAMDPETTEPKDKIRIFLREGENPPEIEFVTETENYEEESGEARKFAEFIRWKTSYYFGKTVSQEMQEY